MRRELEYTLSFESKGVRSRSQVIAANITYAIAQIRKDYPDAKMFTVVRKQRVLPCPEVQSARNAG